MTNQRFNTRVAGLVGLAAMAAAPAWAQDLSPESGMWIRGGGVLRSGMKVDFRDSSAPTPAGLFDNGFVLPSISTNSPYTWNWGYQSASQLSGNTLNFQRLDGAPRVGSLSGSMGTEFGGELRAGFEVARFTVAKREVVFGLEAGYGYSSISASAGGAATGTATLSTASYSLVGGDGLAILPPIAPYSGTFAGPGPVIGRNPASTGSVTAAGTSTLDMALDAHLHILKAGVYFEVPLGRRFSTGVSLGYCSVLPDAEFRYTETTSYAGGAIPGTSVSRILRRSDWRPGGYMEVRLQYDFTRRLGAYVGAQYEYNQNSTFGDAGRQAILKLGGVYGGTVGLRWTF